MAVAHTRNVLNTCDVHTPAPRPPTKPKSKSKSKHDDRALTSRFCARMRKTARPHAARPTRNAKRPRCGKRGRVLDRDRKLQANDLTTWSDAPVEQVACNRYGVVVFPVCPWKRMATQLREMERNRIRGWSES